MIRKYYTAWVRIIADAGLARFDSPEQLKARKAALQRRLDGYALRYFEQGRTSTQEHEFFKREFVRDEKIAPEGFKPLEMKSTKEEIAAYLRGLYEKYRYSPTIEMTEGAAVVLAKYKTWFEALKEAGLPATNTVEQINIRNENYERQFQKLLRSTYKAQKEGEIDEEQK